MTVSIDISKKSFGLIKSEARSKPELDCACQCIASRLFSGNRKTKNRATAGCRRPFSNTIFCLLVAVQPEEGLGSCRGNRIRAGGARDGVVGTRQRCQRFPKRTFRSRSGWCRLRSALLTLQSGGHSILHACSKLFAPFSNLRIGSSDCPCLVDLFP